MKACFKPHIQTYFPPVIRPHFHRSPVSLNRALARPASRLRRPLSGRDPTQPDSEAAPKSWRLPWLLTSRWADDILLALFAFAICCSSEAPRSHRESDLAGARDARAALGLLIRDTSSERRRSQTQQAGVGSSEERLYFRIRAWEEKRGAVVRGVARCTT